MGDSFARFLHQIQSSPFQDISLPFEFRPAFAISRIVASCLYDLPSCNGLLCFDLQRLVIFYVSFGFLAVVYGARRDQYLITRLQSAYWVLRIGVRLLWSQFSFRSRALRRGYFFLVFPYGVALREGWAIVPGCLHVYRLPSTVYIWMHSR